MSKVLSAIVLIAGLTFACPVCGAFEEDDQGRLKFSFDSLPFLGGSDKEGAAGQERAVSDQEEDEYTYDAMGRKVPVRTLRSGDASPVR